MLSEFVTTVSRRRSVSTRATSVVVVPPVIPTAAPSATRAAAVRAMRDFCSLAVGAAVAERELVEHAVGDGAAVRPRQQPLPLEEGQVAADRGRRDPHRVDQVADADRPLGGELRDDVVEPIGLAHRGASYPPSAPVFC